MQRRRRWRTPRLWPGSSYGRNRLPPRGSRASRWGGRRLLRAEAAQLLGDGANDVTAVEVLGNIQAMSWSLSTVGPGDDITPELLLEAHRRLLAGSRLEEMGGTIREEQNWIGGSSYNPCSAALSPPPEYVPELLEDLCNFTNSDSLSAVTQAALAHAQFETIHPFVDGNGRIGRALVHLVLRRRGLAVRVLPQFRSSWRPGPGTTSTGSRPPGTEVVPHRKWPKTD